MTPREPDRFETWKVLCYTVPDYRKKATEELDTLIRVAESSALERAAQIVDANEILRRNVRELLIKDIRALIPPAAAPAAETGKARCQCTIGSVATSCVYAAPDRVCECACHATPAPAQEAETDDFHPLSLRAEFEKYKKAQARIAELEAALHEAFQHAWNAGCRGYLGENFFARIEKVLAARAAPQSGEGR